MKASINQKQVTRSLNCAFPHYTCNTDAWPIRQDDYASSANEIQHFLYAWQHDSSRCSNGIHGGSLANIGGIGASISLWGLADFSASLKSNRIHRPMGSPEYLWADLNQMYCSLGIRALDCYFKPLSTCRFEGIPSATPQLPVFINQVVRLNSTKVCDIGAYFKKPIQWVLGHLILYMIRPSDDLQYLIDGRVNRIMKMKKGNQTMLAVHVRTGTPDQNRAVLPFSSYMEYIDKKAEEMARMGKPVGLVYVASQSNQITFESVAKLNELYPREFRLVFLPQYQIPCKMDVTEIETFMKSSASANISRFHLMAEFMADIQLLSMADVFIGTKSTIYLTVAAIRHSLSNQDGGSKTCMIFGSKLICEGSMQSIELIWRWYLGGFTGGSY